MAIEGFITSINYENATEYVKKISQAFRYANDYIDNYSTGKSTKLSDADRNIVFVTRLAYLVNSSHDHDTPACSPM